MNQCLELSHRPVIDVRSDAHFFLFLFILDSAGRIDRERAVDESRCRVHLHQRKQETSLQFLINCKRSILVEILCNDFHNRIGVRIPYFLNADILRNMEETIQEINMMTISAKQKTVETLEWRHRNTSQIADRHRVNDQHLPRPLLLQCSENSICS